MHKLTLARMILTAVLVTGVVASFALDWSPNHLLNPLWQGHARFHGALLLFFLAGVSTAGVWLLWRESSEPKVAINVAAAISRIVLDAAFLHYVGPSGIDRVAGDPNAIPTVAGHVFYPNLGVAAGFLALTILAWRIAQHS